MFCQKKPKKPSLEEKYEAWKEYVNREDSLVICVYEDPYTFSLASCFFPKEEGKVVGIKEFRKSYIQYEEVKEKTDEECPVCLDKLQKRFSKKYVVLECGHKFHTKCFHKHVKTQHSQCLIATCPMCRFGVSPDEEGNSKS